MFISFCFELGEQIGKPVCVCIAYPSKVGIRGSVSGNLGAQLAQAFEHPQPSVLIEPMKIRGSHRMHLLPGR